MSPWWLLLIVPAAILIGLGIGYVIILAQFAKGLNW